MEARYIRNIPALTERECFLLRTKRVLVVGCGGLGGHIIDQLARIGVGSLRVVDGDVFEESNLNRQLLSDVTRLGQRKTDVAKSRIASVNPDVVVDAYHGYLEEDNACQLLEGCDAVIGALDNIYTRRVLESACEQMNIPYIYGAIHGWVAQAALSMPGDGLVALLFPQDVVIGDKSVLSFTPALCAAMQACLCVKLLTGKAVETGVLHYTDLFYEEYTQIPMK